MATALVYAFDRDGSGAGCAVSHLNKALRSWQERERPMPAHQRHVPSAVEVSMRPKNDLNRYPGARRRELNSATSLYVLGQNNMVKHNPAAVAEALRTFDVYLHSVLFWEGPDCIQLGEDPAGIEAENSVSRARGELLTLV